MTRCLSCQRFVNPAKCNHYYVECGAVRVEYECERCAEARPYDEPPSTAASREGDR